MSEEITATAKKTDQVLNFIKSGKGIACIAAALVLLAALGTVGEYVGKIYLETKARPRFVIETVAGQLEQN